MGHTWESFTQNEFFRVFDFELLERKLIEPIFVPSSDKTNFDATYDLEELLLEEAPLEARARRQKPRERLKDDATEKEIREDTLYRSIETDFKPFDYTQAAYKKSVTARPNFLIDRLLTKSRITEESGRLTDETQHDSMPQALTTEGNVPAPAPMQNGSHSYGPHSTTSASASRHSGSESVPGRPERLAPSISQQQQQQQQNDFKSARSSGKRITSPAGGVSVTLDGSGSWSELARQDATLPADANVAGDGKGESSGGMFGFLKSKKGRNNSPRPKERGVLGKEGARVVIG